MTDEIATLRKRIILSPHTPMTDERFIANIDDINELINLCDDEGIDRTRLRSQLGEFYPGLIRRIEAQPSIQQAHALIRSLYRLIFDRGYDETDRGPLLWRETLNELTSRLVDDYRRTPSIPSWAYLPHLLYISARRGQLEDIQSEVDRILADLIACDWSRLPLDEQLHRIGARQSVSGYLIPSPAYEPAWSAALTHLPSPIH